MRLDVSWHSISHKAKRLGLPPKDGLARNIWKPEEDKILIDGIATNSPWLEIAEKLPGRSGFSCRKRASRLRAENPQVEVPPEPESATEPPIWTPPTKIIRPVESIPPARSCEYPTWSDQTPRFERRVCAAPLWRGSYCLDHWGLCFEGDEAERIRRKQGIAA
jgi:hypothetical protein